MREDVGGDYAGATGGEGGDAEEKEEGADDEAMDMNRGGWMVEWLWQKMNERADVFRTIDTTERPDALNGRTVLIF